MTTLTTLVGAAGMAAWWASAAVAWAQAEDSAVVRRPSHQVTIPLGADLTALDWQVLRVGGRAPTRFIGLDDRTIEIIADRSMAALYEPVQIDLREQPCLSWRWQVIESSIPRVDLSRRGEDDRPLMVTVGFPFQPDRASIWERMKYLIAKTATGRDIPGRLLAYVWGGSGERGELVQSPQLQTAGLMRILRPTGSAMGAWFEESVDLALEFEAFFGFAPPRVIEIGLLGDSDDTGSASVGRIADLAFSSQCRVAR
jgi:hypothetical protein